MEIKNARQIKQYFEFKEKLEYIKALNESRKIYNKENRQLKKQETNICK